MFTLNDDLSIYATRGDIVFFSVTAQEDGQPYSFEAGDVVRIKIYGKKDAENVVLQKDFPVTKNTESVEIFLTKEDMKIGEVISKHKDYWYEVVLNDDTEPQTIIGYDEDGAKVFRLFPEGDDIPEFVPDPEDIRVMDDELDITSTRPVQNQAIAKAVVNLRANFEEHEKIVDSKTSGAETAVTKIERAVAVERNRIDELLALPAGSTTNDARLEDICNGADGKVYDNPGEAVREQIRIVNDHIKIASDIIAIHPALGQIIDGYLISTEGRELKSDSWLCTDFIRLPFVPLFKVNVSCTVLGSASIVFYDKDKNVILGINGNSIGDYGYSASDYKQTFSIPLPEGAAYIRMCGCKSYFEYDSADAFVVEGVTGEWYKSVDELKKQAAEDTKTLAETKNRIDGLSATYNGKKVLVFGDSISADAYGDYTKWVTMLIEDGFFPADTVNSSQHATGFVARYNDLRNDFVSRIEAIENMERYDLVVVFGGINDYIRSVPMGESGGGIRNGFIPAVDHFFDYLVHNFFNARIVVFTPLHTYAFWENAEGNKQEVYSDYIKVVAKKYHLPILNLADESGFHPEVSGFRETWTLVPAGYITPDGVHPTEEYQRRFLMPMIKGFLKNLL